MSGGHFDYDQYKIGYIADSIEQLILTNDDKTLNEWGGQKGRGYSPETIARFRDAIEALKAAQIFAQRVDWLVSCDDGEDNFHQRLNDELGQLAAEK